MALGKDSVLCCSDCKSDKFVWDWENGDVVCTGCGLVQQDRFIDDRVPWKEYDDYAPVEESVPARKVLDMANMAKSELFGGNIDNVKDLIMGDQACDKAGDKACDKAGDKIQVAADLYENTKGFTAKTFCGSMKVKTSKFWKQLEQKGAVDKDRTFDILKRIVYESTDIPSDKSWEVIKVANKFREMLSESAEKQKIKSDRLMVSLMIIVVCDILKLGPKVCAMCRKYKLGVYTFKKHEKLLQEVLKRDRL
jgi:transcription initiation factor TFIIIB Brf1 subunit/transcription initiation factor TFIIB